MKKTLNIALTLTILVLSACASKDDTSTTAFTTPTVDDGSIYSLPASNPTQATATAVAACTGTTVSTTGTTTGCGTFDYNKLFQAAYASYGQVAVRCFQPLTNQLAAIPQGDTPANYLLDYNQVVGQLALCFQRVALEDQQRIQWTNAVKTIYARIAFAMNAVCRSANLQNCN